MKRLVYTLHIVMFCLLLTSCDHLNEGIVTDKKYEEASSNLILIPMKIGKTTIMQQYWIYDNEDWAITIEGHYKGKLKSEKVYVSKECFDSLKIGDTWQKSEDCSYLDNNNTKIRK